jgi:hypothetical protein
VRKKRFEEKREKRKSRKERKKKKTRKENGEKIPNLKIYGENIRQFMKLV